jgi:hypothetical protein
MNIDIAAQLIMIRFNIALLLLGAFRRRLRTLPDHGL